MVTSLTKPIVEQSKGGRLQDRPYPRRILPFDGRLLDGGQMRTSAVSVSLEDGPADKHLSDLNQIAGSHGIVTDTAQRHEVIQIIGAPGLNGYNMVNIQIRPCAAPNTFMTIPGQAYPVVKVPPALSTRDKGMAANGYPADVLSLDYSLNLFRAITCITKVTAPVVILGGEMVTGCGTILATIISDGIPATAASSFSLRGHTVPSCYYYGAIWPRSQVDSEEKAND